MSKFVNKVDKQVYTKINQTGQWVCMLCPSGQLDYITQTLFDYSFVPLVAPTIGKNYTWIMDGMSLSNCQVLDVVDDFVIFTRPGHDNEYKYPLTQWVLKFR